MLFGRETISGFFMIVNEIGVITLAGLNGFSYDPFARAPSSAG